MFGNAISEVTFYHPGKQSLSAALSAKASTGDFPQSQNSPHHIFNRSLPRPSS